MTCSVARSSRNTVFHVFAHAIVDCYKALRDQGLSKAHPFWPEALTRKMPGGLIPKVVLQTPDAHGSISGGKIPLTESCHLLCVPGHAMAALLCRTGQMLFDTGATRCVMQACPK